jgi:predicted nucleic acid-binding protein
MKLTTEDTENTEQATPETDAKVSGHIGFYSCATVPAELCRRMERERDEARATLTDIHRWIERNHPDNFIDSMTFHQNLERVGDRWYDRLDIVERERDEARDIIRKAIMKFSEDDSDGRIAAAMLAILSKKEPVS